MMADPWLLLLIAIVAFAYAMVGHGGASGYLALLAMAGFAPALIKPTALVLNLGVSGITFLQFRQAGYFRWSLFWPFAVASVPFAYAGGMIDLPGDVYVRVLGLCLLVAAGRLFGLFGRGSAVLRTPPLLLALAFGAGIGFISGLIGIGGGVLLSPILLLCGWADAKGAAAISSLFILVNSAAGLLGSAPASNGFSADMWAWLVAALIGGTLGSWVGARKAPEPRLRQALAVVLVLASVKLIWP